ncbi:MAG: cupin domain-containing protein [Actinomycetota bacterium]
MTAASKPFESADETRPIGQGTLEVLQFDTASVAKFTMQPGWRWSTDMKPIAGTDHCQKDHLGYGISGMLHVVTDDGSEIDVGPGDAYVAHPGHDAWVVGDEPFVALEFQTKTAEEYAKT